jgi:hypothetical protein
MQNRTSGNDEFANVDTNCDHRDDDAARFPRTTSTTVKHSKHRRAISEPSIMKMMIVVLCCCILLIVHYQHQQSIFVSFMIHPPQSKRSVTTTAVTADAYTPPLPDPTTQVVCIEGDLYGRTFNQIMQYTAAVSIANDIQRQFRERFTNETTIKVHVGIVSAEFNTFYKELFLDDIKEQQVNGDPQTLLDYRGICTYTYSPRKLLYAFTQFSGYSHDMMYHSVIKNIPFPKSIYRQQAEIILSELREQKGQLQYPIEKIISVHRRNLEGVCISQAQSKSRIVCPNYANKLSVSDLVGICNMEYRVIAQLLQKDSSVADKNHVILMTDHQVPSLDETFPHVSNYSFPIEMWIMILSDQHYGNPMSTIDTIVYFWRLKIQYGNMNKYISEEGQQDASLLPNPTTIQQFPSSCYQLPRPYIQRPYLIPYSKVIVPSFLLSSATATSTIQERTPSSPKVTCIADDETIDIENMNQDIFHHILRLAVAFAYAKDIIDDEHGNKIGLGPKFSTIYETWFDNSHDDVLLHHFNYDTTGIAKKPAKCYQYYQPKELYERFYEGFSYDVIPLLSSHLLPKRVYQQEALIEMQKLVQYPMPTNTTNTLLPTKQKNQLITVHRDTINNQCTQQAEKLQYIVCPNYNSRNELQAQDFVNLCNINYTTVAPTVRHKNDDENPVVVLFTDLQDRVLDETFPNIILFNGPSTANTTTSSFRMMQDTTSIQTTQSMQVSVWMMILSDVHYGNPMSLSDLILYYWRQNYFQLPMSQKGTRNKNANNIQSPMMMPTQCYPV